VHLPDGQVITAPAGTLASPNADDQPVPGPTAAGTVSFDVPDTTTSGTLDIHPSGTIFLRFDVPGQLVTKKVAWVVKTPAQLAFDVAW
jgi:hypothetical protein